MSTLIRDNYKFLFGGDKSGGGGGERTGSHPVNPSIIICPGTGPQRKQAKQTVATPPGGSKGISGPDGI